MSPEIMELVVVSSDQAFCERVASIAKKFISHIEPRIFDCIDALTTQGRKSRAVVVMVDVDPEPQHAIRQISEVVECWPQARCVAVGDTPTRECMMLAMEAGVRHYIDKRQLAEKLPEIFDAAAATLFPDSHLGRVVSVLSAGGGCGATTLAVNLAMELRGATDEPSLLIDLDDAYGAVATHLSAGGQYSIADVMNFGGRIDPQVIMSTVFKHEEGVHALISPVSVDFIDPQAMDYERLPRVLKASRLAYPWTVIDAPRQPVRVMGELARGSATTLIVSELCVKDIRVARAIRDTLLRYGVADASIRYVINRQRNRHHQISMTEAVRTLGREDVYVVRNDFSHAVESMNLGQFLSTYAPRSGVRRDILAIAEAIRHDTADTQAPEFTQAVTHA